MTYYKITPEKAKEYVETKQKLLLETGLLERSVVQAARQTYPKKPTTKSWSTFINDLEKVSFFSTDDYANLFGLPKSDRKILLKRLLMRRQTHTWVTLEALWRHLNKVGRSVGKIPERHQPSGLESYEKRYAKARVLGLNQRAAFYYAFERVIVLAGNTKKFEQRSPSHKREVDIALSRGRTWRDDINHLERTDRIMAHRYELIAQYTNIDVFENFEPKRLGFTELTYIERELSETKKKFAHLVSNGNHYRFAAAHLKLSDTVGGLQTIGYVMAFNNPVIRSYVNHLIAMRIIDKSLVVDPFLYPDLEERLKGKTRLEELKDKSDAFAFDGSGLTGKDLVEFKKQRDEWKDIEDLL